MNKKTKIAIIVLSCVLFATLVGLGVPLGIYVYRDMNNHKKINGIYEKSYYEITDSLDNAQTKLSKVNVVGNSTVQRELLYDVWKECGIAVTNLSELTSVDGNTETVTKFLNQTGDYCYYLASKLAVSDLTKEEKDNIKTFYNLIAKLNASFAEIGEDLTDGDKINADVLSDLSAVGGFIKNYSSIDYPELIYDGPFSDGLNDRDAKFLADKTEISEDTAKEKILAMFSDATEITKTGDGSGNIESYIYTFKSAGSDYCVFITKKGGYISALNTYEDINNPTLTEDECVQKAADFLIRAGYADMSSVWVYDNDSTVYVNFAYDDNGVIYYPDLVKVKVSLQDGKILGLEAQNYIYNHTTRNLTYDNSAESSIKISSDLTVVSTRYCVIPTDWNEEVYAKEVKGTYDGMTYYIYYDMSTAEEIRALVVVDEDGSKLI